MYRWVSISRHPHGPVGRTFRKGAGRNGSGYIAHLSAVFVFQIWPTTWYLWEGLLCANLQSDRYISCADLVYWPTTGFWRQYGCPRPGTAGPIDELTIEYCRWHGSPSVTTVTNATIRNDTHLRAGHGEVRDGRASSRGPSAYSSCSSSFSGPITTRV